MTAIVPPGVTLSGKYGYTDAKYKSFAGFADPGSLEFVRVPRHTFNVAAQYERQLQDDSRINARVTTSYTGRYFHDDPNLLSQKGYALVDANLAYTTRSD